MAWNLEQLRSFVTAAEKGSFSAAAREQGRAQSAISTHIALLEAELGVDLFDRSTRVPTLTKAGEHILAEAREVLRQCRQLNTRALAICQNWGEQLSMAVSDGLPYPVIINVLTRFANTYPYISVRLLHCSPAEVRMRVEKGDVHMGLVFEEFETESDSIGSYWLGNVDQVLMAAKEHPLAQKDFIKRSDLVQYRQIIMRDNSNSWQGKTISPLFWETNTYFAAAALAGWGVGWTTLPVTMARLNTGESPSILEFLPPNLVVLKRHETPIPPANVMLLWKEELKSWDVAVWLRKNLVQGLQGKVDLEERVRR